MLMGKFTFYSFLDSVKTGYPGYEDLFDGFRPLFPFIFDGS